MPQNNISKNSKNSMNGSVNLSGARLLRRHSWKRDRDEIHRGNDIAFYGGIVIFIIIIVVVILGIRFMT